MCFSSSRFLSVLPCLSTFCRCRPSARCWIPTVRLTILNLIADTLTPLQMNTVLIGLERLDPRESTPMVRPRFGHARIHPRPLSLRSSTAQGVMRDVMFPISVRLRTRTFGFARPHARQTCAIAWTSFWTIAKSAAGLVLASGRDTRGPVDARAHETRGSSAASQNSAVLIRSDRPGC